MFYLMFFGQMIHSIEEQGHQDYQDHQDHFRYL